jgi:hypothetical protein
VEQALQSVCDGLDLLGPGPKDWVFNDKDSFMKPKPKSKLKKGLNLKSFKLGCKPKSKPMPKQSLGSVTDHGAGSFCKPKIHSSRGGSLSGSVLCCGAPSCPMLVSALPEVGIGTACLFEASGSILRPEASSAVAQLLPKDAQTSPGQCYASKPLKFYNPKSKPNRLSMLDDSLIIETLSVINAPHVVPWYVGSTSSPLFVLAQTSLEGALIRASRVPPARGLLRRGFLKPSSSVVIHGCSPEPVLPLGEVMGLDCSQVLSVVHSLPTDGVQLTGSMGIHT